MLSLIVGLGIKLMLPAIRAPRPPDFPQPGDRLEANRQDIAYLRATLHEMDRSFTPDQWQEFDEALDGLNEGAGSLDAGRLEMGLAAAVAKSNNGHSNVMGAGWGLTLNSVPVRFYWFADGLYVLKADPSYSDILGAKVLAIGGRTPDELVESLSAYTGGRSTLKRESAIHFIESPQAMHAVGLLESPARMELSVVTLEGIALERLVTAVDLPVSGPPPERTELTLMVDPRDLYWPRRELSPIPLPDKAPFPQPTSDGRQWSHVLDGRDIAFTLQNPNQFYWAIDLAGGQALYLQLNATMNDPVQQPLAAFLEGVLERVAATQPRYAIVDFRSNLGGSYQLPAEFTRELPKRMPQNGRIFILTSANTYSAGVVTTARLKYFSGSRGEIVGEPMGDYSQFWAEAATRIVLPNSGLRVG
jgi:hypothetical protein